MIEDSYGFAEAWIAAWNAHDLERILDHYDEAIEFLSPVALKVAGTGRISGKPALRAYWAAGLRLLPDLRFELSSVLKGHDCLTILYRNQRGQSVAETFEFGSDGKVVRAFACYGPG